MAGEKGLPGMLLPDQLASGNEFTDREQQFPADRSKTPGDIANAGRLTAQMIAAPPGEPPIDYDVRCVYDSRPINGYDFNVASFAAIGSTNSWSVNFEVPKGYVAVVRSARHFLDPLPSSLDSENDVLATLLVNNIEIQNNNNIPVGVQSDTYLKYFYVVDELNTFGLKLTPSSVPLNTNAWVTFYGNLISKTGRPIPFEIANPNMIRQPKFERR